MSKGILTKREREVFELLIKNYTTKEILTRRGRLETIKIYDKEFKKI